MKFTLLLLIILAATFAFGQQSREWSIVASYEVPGKASGLAYDGTYLYYGIYGSNGDHVYRVDPSNGSATIQFTNPDLEDSFGLTWDGSQLWAIVQPSGSANPAMAQQMDLSGNFGDNIVLPDHYMSGIAYDNGDFWVNTYYPDPGQIYKVDDLGNILDQFDPPNDQGWDLCRQGDFLWFVDYWAHMIYKMDLSGNVIESHPSENIKPSGIVWDGQYLWYVDGQTSSPSTLYKVDLGGTGTPVINVPVTEHDYGTITIGDSSVWYAMIQNVGTDDLTIEQVAIPDAAPIFSWSAFPQTIGPGEFIEVDLIYKPQEQAALETTVTIHSTDPINPEVDIDLIGEGVSPGPAISVPVDYHDYGVRRQNAFSKWYLLVKNTGDASLIIDGIESDSDHFIVDENFAFPYEVTVLGSVEIGIWFHPEDGITYEGMLQVLSNDPNNSSYPVTLEGEGIDKTWPIGDPLWDYFLGFATDNSPKAIAPIKDVTGDDIDDVIICSEDNYIRCFNGNASVTGDVIWERVIYSGNVWSQSGLTISDDINFDGYQDVIAGTTGSDRSIIALSGKTGEIIWKHQTDEYGDGGWVYQVDCSYDYTGDAFPDILAATGDDSGDTGPKRIYCLDALTGESEWECFTGGPNFSVIGIKDATGDGKADVLAGASDEGETQGVAYGIDGEYGTIFWEYYPGGTSVWALAQIDDIDNNDVKDVMIGDFAGNYYLLESEFGGMIESGSIGPKIILRFETLEDVNGDGHPDVLFAHSGTNGIVVDGITGDNIWLHPLADKSWNVTPIDDINGDEINDVVIGTLFTNNLCYFLGGADGAEKTSVPVDSPIDAIYSIPDITGDGTMEVVVGLRNGYVTCYSGGLNAGVGIRNQRIDDNTLNISSFPNPFSDHTTLSFELESDAHVSIDVFDVNGVRVYTMLNKQLQYGSYSLTWDGSAFGGISLPSGIYFYNASVDGTQSWGKLIKY